MTRADELAQVVAANAEQLQRALAVVEHIAARFAISPEEVITEFRRQQLLRQQETRRRTHDRVSIASRHSPRPRRARW